MTNIWSHDLNTSMACVPHDMEQELCTCTCTHTTLAATPLTGK